MAEKHPRHAPALSQLLLLDYRDGGSAEKAINGLEGIIKDAQFQSVEALTALASVQLIRNSTGGLPSPMCQAQSDAECALLNLRRALAVDSSYLPAYGTLASYYLAKAQSNADRPAMLSLAMRVCRRAMEFQGTSASMQNTVGVIQWQLGNLSDAVTAFDAASRLDPSAVEPLMNAGAAAIAVRDYGKAETSYRKAIALQPGSYDATLGLALALRGLLPLGKPDQQSGIANVEAELERCKMIDPKRPDAHFNHGVLLQDFAPFGGSVPKAERIAELQRAESLFRRFVELARGMPKYEASMVRANARLQEIADSIQLIQLN